MKTVYVISQRYLSYPSNIMDEMLFSVRYFVKDLNAWSENFDHATQYQAELHAENEIQNLPSGIYQVEKHYVI